MYWLLLLCFLPDGELVLRNGKVLRYQGEYIQEGRLVRFTDHSGKYLQLPAKIVDFEKTLARINGKKAKAAAAEETKRALAEEQSRRDSRMVADLVGDVPMSTRELSMNDKEIDEKGHARNGVNLGHTDLDDEYYDADEEDLDDDTSVDGLARKREFFVSRYQSLVRIEQNLIREIAQLAAAKERTTRTNTRKSLGKGGNPGSTYNAGKSAEVQDLEDKLYRVRNKMQNLVWKASSAGVYDIR